MYVCLGSPGLEDRVRHAQLDTIFEHEKQAREKLEREATQCWDDVGRNQNSHPSKVGNNVINSRLGEDALIKSRPGALAKVHISVDLMQSKNDKYQNFVPRGISAEVTPAQFCEGFSHCSWI